MSATGNTFLRGLQHVLEVLDELLLFPISAMTSRYVNEGSGSSMAEMSAADGVDESQVACCIPDDDSLRPKSFLHDEMDEFNQILSELLNSARKSNYDIPTDVLMTSSWRYGRDVGDLREKIPDSSRLSDLDDNAVCCRCCHGMTSSSINNHDDDDDDEIDNCDLLQIIEEDDDVLTSTSNVKASLMNATDDRITEDDADSGYQSGTSTMIDRDTATVSAATAANFTAVFNLQRRIDRCNMHSNGLMMSLSLDASAFEGFIRVHINLHKPINVQCVQHDVSRCGSDDVDDDDKSALIETESFYLPANASKVIHINSEMTTPSVIQALLDKFLITDNCQKFALYEKVINNSTDERTLDGMLRKLNDDDKPLQVCLRWYDDDDDDDTYSTSRRCFVLQDSLTSEINWDAFSLPELEAFLRILRREEESYIYQVQLKYDARKKAAQMRLQQLRVDAE